MMLRKSKFWSLVLAYLFFFAALGMPTPPPAHATIQVVAANPKFKAFEPGTGNPLASGKLYTYLPGTTTLTNTYTSYTGSALNTNPIILDANGECDLYYTGYLKLALYDASNVLVWTKDNIPYSVLTTNVSADNVFLNIGDNTFTVQDALTAWVDVRAYMDGQAGRNTLVAWVVDDTIDVTAAIQAAVNTGKNVFFPAGIYAVDTITVSKHGQKLIGVGAEITNKASVGDRSVLRARGAGAVLDISGHNLSAYDLVFSGNFTANPVVDLTVPSLRIKFYRCVFERTINWNGATGGTLVSIADAGNNQGDQNVFEDCIFYQDNDESGVSQRAVYIQGTNAFMNLFKRCHWYGNRIHAHISGGGATFDEGQVEAHTLAAFYYEGGSQPLTIRGYYTETETINFLTMTDAAGFTPYNVVLLEGNILNAVGAGMSLYPHSKIISRGNIYNGNITINTPAQGFASISSYDDTLQNGAIFTGASYLRVNKFVFHNDNTVTIMQLDNTSVGVYDNNAAAAAVLGVGTIYRDSTTRALMMVE